jgi:hypothetical protein
MAFRGAQTPWENHGLADDLGGLGADMASKWPSHGLAEGSNQAEAFPRPA